MTRLSTGRTSYRDVARQAGTSPASVSRFFNSPQLISPELRDRIAAAVSESGFARRSHQLSAQELSKVPQLGMIIVLTLGALNIQALLAMPIFLQLFGSITQRIQSWGGVLAHCHYSGYGPLPAIIARRQVDGILIYGSLSHMPVDLLAVLHEVPSLWIMRAHSDPDLLVDHIFYDNEAVGGLAVDHLTACGAGSLCVVNVHPAHDAYRQRAQGFVAAAAAAGKPVRSFAVTQDGYPDLRSALRAACTGPMPPDAIFLPSDEQLLEAHQILQHGPRIRLMGCNHDRQILSRISPRPATIDLNLASLGSRAVHQLAWRQAHPEAPPIQVFIAPTVIPAEA